MSRSELLRSIIDEVRTRHKCHTLILYGSHARGDATPVSDYDLIAIRRRGSKVTRDARLWRGVYLDVFIYPERKLNAEELLTIRGGRVLFQKHRVGDALLARVNKVYARGPRPLGADEIAARKVWAKKMLERARVGDAEAHYRRAWLLTALLEDYFVFRNRWYEGPKAALRWLRRHQPRVCARFERALKPGASLSAISDLIEAVVGS